MMTSVLIYESNKAKGTRLLPLTNARNPEKESYTADEAQWARFIENQSVEGDR